MKLISWNIDSLNAALTSDSARAQLSRAVIDTLVAENAESLVRAAFRESIFQEINFMCTVSFFESFLSIVAENKVSGELWA